MDKWSGKTALVTGSSSGIGAETAKSLVKHGVKVVGLARRTEKLEELVRELGKDMFHPIQCDVTEEDDILRAFKWTEENLGGVDILVNNAGVIYMSMVIDMPTEEYRKVIDTNLIAPAICAREFAKSIKKRDACGHILNINSIAGQYPEVFNVPLGMYGASKSGLASLGAELRTEAMLSKLKMRVTNISPGAVLTDMIKQAIQCGDEIVDKIPMLRDKDIADAVIYALSAPQVAEIYELTIIPQGRLTVPCKMEQWANKVAIVTGASSGIGSAVVKSLVSHAVKVVGLARRADKLQEMAKQLGKDKFYPVQCDLVKEDDILRAFKWVEDNFGGANILINNAGVITGIPIIESSTDTYRTVIDTNLLAPAICAREFSKSIKKRKTRGHIVNINSILGHYAEAIQIPVGLYSASKYGVTALTAELRHEFIIAKLDIRVTSVSPGAVLTDLLQNAMRWDDDTARRMNTLRNEHIADGVIYALGTPKGAEVYELTIIPQNAPIELPTADYTTLSTYQFFSNKVSLTMDRWAGKVAVVTGASVGIGFAITQALVKKSVKVVGLARRKEKLQEITNQLGKDKFFGVVCDLRSEADIVKAFNWIQQNHGGADILINNAGVLDTLPIIASALDDYRKVLDTNVIAPAICAREYVKSAKKRNIAGHIINISSMAGHNAEIVSIPIGMYGASKYALTALAVELRHELADTNIKVTNVSPGAVATDMLKTLVNNPAMYERMPSLSDDDVSDAVMYVLGTPPNVEV
ncbi:uncharacterized protein LOC143216327 [Lasioglossum baleicum]|uniref:uncharacterized protein LOC143216327 n=1 Tax=Lasioglossum baleicum TaxID=434251 RepID=UPI003FCD7567